MYYALSDTYVADFETIKDTLYYEIVDKKSYRFLTKSSEISYVGSRKMSERFQFIKAGSVFYVKKDREMIFKGAISNSSLEQIGFNKIIEIGD